MVRIHSGNGPHEEMDRRAIACFDQALEDVGCRGEPLRQVLHDYFAWATTTTMSRYHASADDVPTVCASRAGRGTARKGDPLDEVGRPPEEPRTRATIGGRFQTTRRPLLIRVLADCRAGWGSM